eukprot:TRINITY_DN9328_c0_g1_i1.p1 TRINITY_DN9328_c0_g1~~TRINITY_DN9328_c0_g1_i1.p1  ORF type:complete len:130 (-),score=15.12 TRINITY_DN9328_c0_g1_i1:405-794(-)
MDIECLDSRQEVINKKYDYLCKLLLSKNYDLGKVIEFHQKDKVLWECFLDLVDYIIIQKPKDMIEKKNAWIKLRDNLLIEDQKEKIKCYHFKGYFFFIMERDHAINICESTNENSFLNNIKFYRLTAYI